MKRKAKRILGGYGWKHPEHFADHMAQCSCHMCGNPRKHFGEKTMQEKKADEATKWQLRRQKVRLR